MSRSDGFARPVRENYDLYPQKLWTTLWAKKADGASDRRFPGLNKKWPIFE
jgi:hypothetical protein